MENMHTDVRVKRVKTLLLIKVKFEKNGEKSNFGSLSAVILFLRFLSIFFSCSIV